MASLSADVTGLKFEAKIEDEITKAWYRDSLSYRSRLPDDSRLLPPYFVSTKLFQSLRSLCRDHTSDSFGMTYVYFGARRTGKTIAARGMIDSFLRTYDGKQPCLFVEANESIRDNVRAALGTPESVSDIQMITDVCEKLSSSGNVLGRCPPLVILDDIVALSKDDYGFVRKLFKAFYNSRVLMVMLTDSETIANELCGMNGKERIKPLTSMYAFSPDCQDWSIVANSDPSRPFIPYVAVDIIWQPNNWTLQKLSKLVHLYYPGEDLSAALVQDDETDGTYYSFISNKTPDAAVRAAGKYILQKNNSDSNRGERAKVAAWDDPKEDEDDTF